MNRGPLHVALMMSDPGPQIPSGHSMLQNILSPLSTGVSFLAPATVEATLWKCFPQACSAVTDTTQAYILGKFLKSCVASLGGV